MDFSIYCENILIPFLDMIVDLYIENKIGYKDALRLGSAMCDVEQCLYDKELINVQIDIVDNILEDFEFKLRKG